ncbi:MAG: dephospho-CoA kinase [Lachnospiraceae bacterium]|nr:dephospho-CoA kinase [Lachnospiraceae bacterium]
MKVIGITGGVGCGKSTIVTAMEKKYSCAVLMADDAAHKVYAKGCDAYHKLVELLGQDVLDEDKNIDRKKMAALILDDEELLGKVNSIVHPAVKDYILSRIKEEKESKEHEFFLLEAALLIECGYNDIVDEMWYVYADESTRRARLKTQRGYTDERIDSILDFQLSDEGFRNGSDFVIDNSNTVDESMLQIAKRIGK